jgi:hypothetical protein
MKGATQMIKRSPIFILLLCILFTLVTVTISAAESKQDKKFSMKKCNNLGGEVTSTYLGKQYDGKLCVYKNPPGQGYKYIGVTICNNKWKKCEYRPYNPPLGVRTPRRSPAPDTGRPPPPTSGAPSSGVQRDHRGPVTVVKCYPKSNEVAFYEDQNSKGNCSVRGMGEYPTSQAIGLPNNSISSAKVGSGVQVYICTDIGFGGKCLTFKRNFNLLSRASKVKDNTVSSLRVERRVIHTSDCIPSPNQVALFKDNNWVGPCVVLDIGRYRNAGAIGLSNDSISSIQLGSNAKIRVYQHKNFKGDQELYSTSQITLNSGDATNFVQTGAFVISESMDTINSWNNEISSVEIMMK